MNNRFLQYIRYKHLTQKKISELSCVSESMVSRFCQGNSIASDKLQKMLQVCDDLSLEWLFFGSGDMLRSRDSVTFNVGAFSGSDFATGDSVLVKNSKGINVERQSDKSFLSALSEKDRVISEKDRIISEKDCLILRLQEMLVRE